MQLTNTQLDLIDRFLEQHQLDFLDFKLEVKDHLACETEQIMANENIDFEEAILKATKSWESELKVKKSWIISNERLFPAFIIKKIKRKVILHYGVVLILSLTATIIFSNLKIENHTFYKFIIGICGIVYFLLRRIINKNIAKTSYRFHFDYFYMPVLLVFVYFFVSKTSFTYANFIGFIVIVNFPFSIFYFIKHQQFVKKYNLK